MATPNALLDSNIIIAIVDEAHQHHEHSLALLIDAKAKKFAVSAHSFAETYSTLTRRSPSSPFRWSPDDAWFAIESVGIATTLVGLTPGQTFDTIKSYASGAGVGARLYDRLIGQVAVQYDIRCIVTWNTGHMRDLFPELTVLDPLAYVTQTQ